MCAGFFFCEGMMTCITSDSPDMGNADCWVTNLQLKFTGSEMQVAGSSLRQTSCGSYIWKGAKKQKGCVTKSVWKQVLTCVCGNLILLPGSCFRLIWCTFVPFLPGGLRYPTPNPEWANAPSASGGPAGRAWLHCGDAHPERCGHSGFLWCPVYTRDSWKGRGDTSTHVKKARHSDVTWNILLKPSKCQKRLHSLFLEL